MMWKKKNDKQPSQETERSKCWPGLVVFNPKQFAKLKKKKKKFKSVFKWWSYKNY